MTICSIPLRRPPLMTGGLQTFLVLVFFGFVLEFLPLVSASLVGVATVVVVWVLILLVRRPREDQFIELRDDVIRLPRRWGSTRLIDIPYAELRSAGYVGKGRQTQLMIQAARATVAFPLSAFTDGDILPILREKLYARLERLEDGELLRERVSDQDALGELVRGRRPDVTYILSAAIGVAFLAIAVSELGEDEFALIRFGALVPSLVEDGQWWRLLSSTFLHVNALHAWFNVAALIFLGGILERSLGAARFTVIYAASAVAGSVVSMAFMNAFFSVGASGAIFGLLGALAVLHWRWRHELPAGIAQSIRWWVVILGLNVALPVVVPQIDYMAHLGGFVLGGLTTWVLVRRTPAAEILRSGDKRLRGLSIGCAVLVAVACGLALWHGREPRTDEQLAVMRRIMEDATSSPAAKNNAAWAIATDLVRVPKGESREWFELALRAASAAVVEVPDNPSCRDTLSHVLHRLGRLDEAIAAEKKAIDLSEDDGQTANYKKFYYSLNQEKFEAQVRELKAQQGGQGR